MHIITHSRLKTFWQKYPNARPGLQGWYIRTKQAHWDNFVELRRVYPSADQVNKFTVFNIGGNNYRLITFVDISLGKQAGSKSSKLLGYRDWQYKCSGVFSGWDQSLWVRGDEWECARMVPDEVYGPLRPNGK